jgi:hypothetical protein
MRRSFTLGLTGLTLLAGCAAGIVDPTSGLPGTDTPSGPSDTTDAAVPTLEDSGGGAATPHLGTDASTPPATPKASEDAGASADAGGADTYAPEDAGHEKKDAGSSKETDSGSTSTTICKGYAPPDVTASCSACKSPPCQANGCYGGYWCEMSEDSCHEDPPSGCE